MYAQISKNDLRYSQPRLLDRVNAHVECHRGFTETHSMMAEDELGRFVSERRLQEARRMVDFGPKLHQHHLLCLAGIDQLLTL